MKVVNLLTGISTDLIGESIVKNIYVLKRYEGGMVFISNELYSSLNTEQQSELNTFIKDEDDYTPEEMCDMDVLVIKTDSDFDILEFIGLVKRYDTSRTDRRIEHDFFQILE